ncbi:glycine hydroxymethyltransferase [Selenomonas sp. oral taxon 137 str. F0430]|uniref:serine hydroxymethyltransferase n=1 Tax=Selenomonas sp. oral taxon 137 TaxID=712531 RepID=UPI0001EB2CD4|nr:serine hydroxymethyltransferase [Selenomonas sp. oral taxon 137]EFR39803.1 glycine hydroxymethyltransferase [Selenomonas sp. oral taxon 137 str. F0430]
METDNLLNHLKGFDAEIFELLQEEIKQQRYTLSLVPTVNAMSPLAAYLEGSLLTNSTIERCGGRVSAIEELVCKRVRDLFGSEHAIVRFGSIAAASRVVFLGLLQQGDRVLSFNRRKEEHCAGLNYTFENFGIDPETQKVDWDAVMELAQRVKPRLIIFSPVSYPRIPNYAKLAEIAHAVGAYLWVDIGQNVGLIAAGLLPSPVAHADVVTFPTNDSLHGPDGAVVLCKEQLAGKLDAAVENTGHVALHMNHLAALGIALHEAASETFRAYGRQVIANAKALSVSLEQSGVKLLCGGTDTHLVLAVPADGIGLVDAAHKLAHVGLRVKTDNVPTMQEGVTLPALRLSSLNPTTRALKEEDMTTVGKLLAKILTGDASADIPENVRQEVAALIVIKPIFSREWYVDTEGDDESAFYDESNSGAVHEHVARARMNTIKKLFRWK